MNNQGSNTRKILQAFGVSFGALLTLGLVVAIFLPKTYQVSRSIEIQAPASKVFTMVSDFSQWKEWSPWYEIEPSAQHTTQGSPGQMGSSATWEGKIIGKGTMTLSQIQAPNELVINIQINEPRKTQSQSKFTFTSKAETTTVMWEDSGPLSYPIGKLFKKNIEEMLGRDFERGLKSLKTKSEKP